MERRESLRLIGAAAVAFPIAASALEKVARDRIIFLGEDGRMVGNELERQMTGFATRFKNIAPQNLHPALLGERTIMVVMLSDADITADLEVIQSRKGTSDSYHVFTITRYMPEQHSMALLEKWTAICRRNRKLIDAIADSGRSFTSLDFTLEALKPHWPVEWVNQKLSLEHKQIVWELMKMT